MASGDKAPNRECLVCGAPYYFCACHDKKEKYQWQMNCDTPQHFQIFLTTLDYRDGVISKQEAKQRLSFIGFKESDLLWCAQSIRDILSDVYTEESSNTKEDE